MIRLSLFVISVILFFSTAYQAFGSAQLDPMKARGYVNFQEIGGDSLHVLSIWDPKKAASVGRDGSFTTVISNLRPQKLSVVDNHGIARALAISLPIAGDNIVFDAQSTACALLFQDAGSFGQPAEVEHFCRLVVHKPSFMNLVMFLKENLPKKNLEEIVRSDAYLKLFEACNREIFKEDKDEINLSLHSAQKELQQLLK